MEGAAASQAKPGRFRNATRNPAKVREKKPSPPESRESNLKSPKGEVVALPRQQCGR